MADQMRLAELQTALQVKVAANREIAASVKTEDGVLIIDAERKSAFNKNMAEIREIKQLIADEAELDVVEKWLSEPATAPIGQAFYAGKAAQVRSIGDVFVNSPEFKALNGGRNGYTMHQAFQLKTAGVPGFGYQVKDVYSDLPTGTPGRFGTVQRDPMVQTPQRRRRVRDLFPARSSRSPIIEFFKVTGYTNDVVTGITNAASVVPERNGGNFGAKPQTSLEFVGDQVTAKVIAHWEAVHRNVLADEPQLRAIIDNELLYGLALREDQQILSGAGTGEDLLGILNHADIQTYSGSSGPASDNDADAVRRAMTLAMLAEYEPTGVVVHPNDWEGMELTKDENGQYLLAVSVAQGADARIWRIPVIDTPAIAENTALVGAFGSAVQLYDLEEASIRVAEQHSDFFIRNAVVVLAEERLALAIKRPESMVKVTLD